jgi:tRNA pseudouridine38-40 synthase
VDSRTIRLDLAYDGTGFRGWASQRDPSIRTVEGVLSAALADVLREPVELSVAGRTDAGVHARGQVASFRTTAARTPAQIRAFLNGRLAPEIAVRSATEATDGFDARFSASAREYRYVIDTAEAPDPFTGRFTWHRPGALAIDPMRRAAASIVGEHDFTSFCRHPGPGRPTTRDLQRLTIRRVGDRVELALRANAFLHQMVRILVGTLVRVGEGRMQPHEPGQILAARDRSKAPRAAPARGLTLERVVYGRRADRR